MTSTTDAQTGVITFNIATDFSSADWSCAPGQTSGSLNAHTIDTVNQAAGSIQLVARSAINSDSNSDPTDPGAWFMAGLGDQ
jgi:hypothetical protein